MTKDDDGLYGRDARAVQECIDLEQVKTPMKPEALAMISVVTHSWGQGDALAGAMLMQMLSRPDNRKFVVEWYAKLTGREPFGGASPMTLLMIFGELAKKWITFKYLDKCGSGSVVAAMEKAKKEIQAGKT